MLSYNKNSDLKVKGLAPPAYFYTCIYYVWGNVVAWQIINNYDLFLFIVIEVSKFRSSPCSYGETFQS